MFGYVFPRKPELKVREYQFYKAVYCSLCRELGIRFGIVSRLLVNYDFVFLALVGLALRERPPGFSEGRCTVNPLKRQLFLKDVPAIEYSAGCLVLSAYHKLSDDVLDERGLKKARALCLKAIFYRAYKRAVKALPSVDALIKMSMELQKKAERGQAADYDSASDASASALAEMFTRLSDDGDERRILRRMGYFSGRFVYLADAGDDLRRDVFVGRYNPAALKHGLASKGGTDGEGAMEAAAGDIREQLYLARSEISACHNLLRLRHCGEILDNIVFLGMEDAIHMIGTERKGRFFNDRSV